MGRGSKSVFDMDWTQRIPCQKQSWEHTLRVSSYDGTSKAEPASKIHTFHTEFRRGFNKRSGGFRLVFMCNSPTSQIFFLCDAKNLRSSSLCEFK